MMLLGCFEFCFVYLNFKGHVFFLKFIFIDLLVYEICNPINGLLLLETRGRRESDEARENGNRNGKIEI